MRTCEPTPDGSSIPCVRTSPLWQEYERRRQTPSDIQDHLLTLYTWTRGWSRPGGARAVELCTRTGNSTVAFLAACEIDRKGHVWSFDIRPAEVPDAFIESEYWTFTQCDALSPEALAVAPPQIDVLFVDLMHTFVETLTACTLWVPRITPGGVALFHDTEWPEINYARPAAHESEVGRALDVYCKMRDLSWENIPGCNGLGILRVR